MGLTLSSKLSLRLAGGAGWTPAALGSSLLGWWDAERSDLITQSGGAVSSWKDVVAGYDLAQATSGSRPVYAATSFNSRPGVTFDGVDDYLGMDTCPFPTGSAESEVWMLIDQQALASDFTSQRLFSYGGASSAGSRSLQRVVPIATNVFRVASGDGSTSTTADNTSSDFSGRKVVRGVFSSTSIRADIEGVAGTAANVTANTGSARVRMMATTTNSNFGKGVINAVIVTAALTAAQATALLAYLGDRRGGPF